jgi:hypothetical protein
LSQVIFWHGHHQYGYFFAAVYLSQEGGGELVCSDRGADSLKALLEGAMGQQAACQLLFYFQDKKKDCRCKRRQKLKLG